MRQNAACFFILALSFIATAQAPGQTDSAVVRAIPDALTVIHSRKSVRHFTGEPVSRQDLETLVKAGMAAPTAMNRQPWQFIIVTGRARLESLAAGRPHAGMLKEAGAAIVVCAQQDKTGGGAEFAIIDCSLASQNILLAAEALHLGALWTAVYPDKPAMNFIAKQLKIPDGLIPLNLIPIGRPTGEDQPKNKYKPDRIHWERW